MSERNEMTEEELANMSDEDMMNMAIAPDLPGSIEEVSGETEEEDPAEEVETNETEEGDEEEGEDEDPNAGSDDDPEGKEAPDADVLGKGDDDLDEAGKPADKPEGKAGEGDPNSEADKDKKPTDGEPGTGEEETAKEDKSAETPVDYKSAYEKIMAPFKANGKEVKLKNPEEAVQLMQMGANYTKKLMALQPNLRMLKMLENNKLLDEDKLSYLIDLDKRDPKAIQKLLKESGLDPLDIDTSAEPDYKSGNYRVSDEEMTFNSTLEEIASNPVGKNLIVEVNRTWDAKSKEALWTDPGILRVMNTQKENGIYDLISNEIDRRRLLGNIQNNVPFIEAYQAVGTEMQERGELSPKEPAKVAEQEPAKTSRVVETRPAKPKPASNNDRARAASPARSTPGKTKEEFNPLALSDEEFEKNAAMAARL